MRIQRPVKICCAFLCWLLIADSLCGCSQKEMTKTISLPETEKTEGISGIVIKDIRQYVYEGHSEDTIWMSWGDPGSDIIYMLRLTDKGYMYQKIDISSKKLLGESYVDDRTMMNVQIAPGGRYISYETEDKAELNLFSLEEEKSIVLRNWKGEGSETFSYVWSLDGTKLFAWQDGDNFNKGPDEDWSVTRYDMNTLESDGEDHFTIMKEETEMEGKGYAWRHVLPNDDGSKVYVREEYQIFSDSKEAEYINSQEINAENENTSSLNRKEERNAENWLLIPDKAQKKKLREYSSEQAWPLRYTEIGLYFRNAEGMLFLAEDIENEPVARELLNTGIQENYICGSGDHVFLADWQNNMETFRISGVRIEDKKAASNQVLYKEKFQNASVSVTSDDAHMIIWGSEYLGGDRYAFKITALGY